MKGEGFRLLERDRSHMLKGKNTWQMDITDNRNIYAQVI